jgi:ectoine hydroxylase-related dioxygenase (phytanoyl-CoA dioxygenase family)
MRKGDLLLFNALLLHSGNLNLSAGIRYSVQSRYTALGAATDEDMGGVIPLARSAGAAAAPAAAPQPDFAAA